VAIGDEILDLSSVAQLYPVNVRVSMNEILFDDCGVIHCQMLEIILGGIAR
jgi:hypothetical protein